MKKVNLKYYVKSFEQFDRDFDQILIAFYNKNVFHVEINLFLESINCAEISKIVNRIKNHSTFNDITNDIIYTFIFTVSPCKELSKKILKIRRLISRVDLIITDENFDEIANTIIALKQKKFPCSLLIKETNFDSIINIYKKISKFRLPLFVDSNIPVNDIFIHLFEEWIYDKDGCRINIFADILSKILLDYWGTKCKYKSCITKNFLIDINGNIYSCSKQENLLCNLNEISSMDDILSCENFVKILKYAITKRKKCKEMCEFYELCQGGCPMKSYNSISDCENKQLFLFMKNATQLVKSIIHNENYQNLNPAVRDMILSSVASNKMFELELIV